MRRTGTLLVLLSITSFACSDGSSTTQVVARVDGEPDVRSEASHVRVEVWGASMRESPDWARRLDEVVEVGGSADAVRWPVQIPLAPKGGDASRVFRVRATALRARPDGAEPAPGDVVAVAQAISGYEKGESLLLRLVLHDECVDMQCTGLQTCAGTGACEAAEFIDPSTLSPFDPDGTVDGGPDMDAGDMEGGMDGGPVDGGMDGGPVDDAGMDGGPPGCPGDAGECGCDGDGDGTANCDEPTFAAAASYGSLSGTPPQSVAAGELTGDGDPDVVVGYGSSVKVFPGAGDGTLTSGESTFVDSDPTGIELADVTGDGVTDVVTANAGAGTVTLAPLQPDGSFGTVLRQEVGMSPEDVAVADVDGENGLDLLVANAGSSNVSVVHQQDDGTLGTAPSSPYMVVADDGDTTEPTAIAALDLDGDGHPDMVAADGASFSDEIYAWMNQTDGTFGMRTASRFGGGPEAMALADLDGDGMEEVVGAPVSISNVAIGRYTGDYSFTELDSYTVGSNARAVTTGDIEGDGDVDVVTANQGGDKVAVLLNDGGLSFTEPTDAETFDVGTDPESVALVDLDGDGGLDIVTANSGSGDVSVLLSN